MLCIFSSMLGDGESSDSGLDTMSSSTGNSFPSDYMDLDEFLSAQTHNGPGNEAVPKSSETTPNQLVACPSRAVVLAKTNSNQMNEGTSLTKETGGKANDAIHSPVMLKTSSFSLKVDSSVLQSIQSNATAQPSATNAIIQWCRSVGVPQQSDHEPNALEQTSGVAHSRRRRSAKYIYNPLPISKKADRKFVCQAEKDEKYWERRIKNNVAAKRSRDMRRQKEIEISEKFKSLERENESLKDEVQRLRVKAVELERKLANLQGGNM